MIEHKSIKEWIVDNLELSDGWCVREIDSQKNTAEIILGDLGDANAILEIVGGKQQIELYISHPDIPTRAEINPDGERIREISAPGTIGPFVFTDSERAIKELDAITTIEGVENFVDGVLEDGAVPSDIRFRYTPD